MSGHVLTSNNIGNPSDPNSSVLILFHIGICSLFFSTARSSPSPLLRLDLTLCFFLQSGPTRLYTFRSEIEKPEIGIENRVRNNNCSINSSGWTQISHRGNALLIESTNPLLSMWRNVSYVILGFFFEDIFEGKSLSGFARWVRVGNNFKHTKAVSHKLGFWGISREWCRPAGLRTVMEEL